MRKFLLLIFFAMQLLSAQVEIKSQSVVSDDRNGTTIFTGDVNIIRGQDLMKANKVIVFLDQKKEVERFEADGNTSFFLISENNQTFKGKSDSFIYRPQQQKFFLTGNAVVEDISNKRKLIGDKIVFDEKTQNANVTGKVKEPVKVIFTLSDKNESK